MRIEDIAIRFPELVDNFDRLTCLMAIHELIGGCRDNEEDWLELEEHTRLAMIQAARLLHNQAIYAAKELQGSSYFVTVDAVLNQFCAFTGEELAD